VQHVQGQSDEDDEEGLASHARQGTSLKQTVMTVKLLRVQATVTAPPLPVDADANPDMLVK